MANESEKQTDWQEEYDKTAGELARSRIDVWQLLNEKEQMRALLERWYEWQMGRGPAGGSVALLQDTRAFLTREEA